ncbi:Beta,beta-carotene 9',10'-oxygenase [Halotydeus destructor]|nr:Beta,beta-carotene 9',10'-oxygenase [Halotydeus destructor]
MSSEVKTQSSFESDPKSRLLYFRSCLQECLEPINATVTGKIPDWLKGTLYRNGPGMDKSGDAANRHYFEGLALIRQFVIDGEKNTLTYNNKYVESEVYKHAIETKRILLTGKGTHAYNDPCKTIFHKLMTFFEREADNKDNVNVNLVAIGDKMYAVTESPYLVPIDKSTLATGEKVDISELVAVHHVTAHLHTGNDGTVYNLGTGFRSSTPTYNIIKIEKSNDDKIGNVSTLCSIPATHRFFPGYSHTFAMTDNYFLMVEQALCFSVPTLLNPFIKNDISSIFTWRKQHMNRFFVIKRDTGEVLTQSYVAEPFFFFHTINAFEDDGHIVFDVCANSSGGNVFASLYEDNLKEEIERVRSTNKRACATRYVLPLAAGSGEQGDDNLIKLDYTTATAKMTGKDIFLTPDDLFGQVSAELPQISYKKYNGKKYRFFYGISNDVNGDDCVMKGDLETKTFKIILERDHFPSEPIFVESPTAETEDDGIVICPFVDEKNENKGLVVILDAKTFTELARAQFETPSALTTDFHGIFCPQ